MKQILLIALFVLFALTSCKQSKQVKTIENLKAGIKGETTASTKYAAFALKAQEEGYDTIARLFLAASKSESIHATNHRKVLEEMGETMEEFTPEFENVLTSENLQTAINGESYEISSMYPQFIVDAKSEKAEKAIKSFTWAIDTEKKHKQLYSSSLQALNAGTENTLPFVFAICPVCGNTYDNSVTDAKCEFCQTDKEKFIII